MHVGEACLAANEPERARCVREFLKDLTARDCPHTTAATKANVAKNP